jgi:hypothetical protein
MRTFIVEWTINVDAENKLEAARKALAIQRDPNSSATIFEVMPEDGLESPETVDLDEQGA